MSPTMVMLIGWIAPAPRPCTARKAMSASMRPGDAAQDRADQEQADAEQHHRLAAEQVGELAVDRHGDRLGQQVDREQPRELGEAAEVGDDRRHGGGDDGRVDRDQADRQHQGDEERTSFRSEADVGACNWRCGCPLHTAHRPILCPSAILPGVTVVAPQRHSPVDAKRSAGLDIGDPVEVGRVESRTGKRADRNADRHGEDDVRRAGGGGIGETVGRIRSGQDCDDANRRLPSLCTSRSARPSPRRSSTTANGRSAVAKVTYQETSGVTPAQPDCA